MSRPVFPAHSCVDEPELSFDPTDPKSRHVHPLLGVGLFGPYSSATLAGLLSTVRVAVIGPSGATRVVQRLLSELGRQLQPKERTAYLPRFRGIEREFGVTAVLAEERVLVELKALSADALLTAEAPHEVLSRALGEALNHLAAHRTEFDVCVVYLPQQWAPGFRNAEADFDLHDFVKAAGADLGVATQIVGDAPQQALAYGCRCSVAWRLSLALYAKAGGVPWKIADTDPRTAYIGVSYAMRATGPRYVTCCSQVFDSDGTGLEFVVYETQPEKLRGDNPFLSREDMARVMARSLALYQRRHAGRVPQRLVVHKSTEFRRQEVDGCFDALASVPELELLQIQSDTIWRGVDIEQKKKPAAYPCDRGTLLPIGEREFLIWTQGNAKGAAGGRDFFKEGKGIPAPLLVRRFAGRGGWSDNATAILGLTKMNWNNDGLCDRIPVTLGFASALATVVKHMPTLSPRPYHIRYFM